MKEPSVLHAVSPGHPHLRQASLLMRSLGGAHRHPWPRLQKVLNTTWSTHLTALARASIPSHLEQQGMCREDGKHSDGATTIPWNRRRVFILGFTCSNTLALTNLSISSASARSLAMSVEEAKVIKYRTLDCFTTMFIHIALETLGSFRPAAWDFLEEIGRIIFNMTQEPRAHALLLEQASAAVQRETAACILRTLGDVFC